MAVASRPDASEERMILECTRCGEPLLPDMQRCRCGAQNPSHVARDKMSLWSSTQGIEAAWFGAAVYGLVLGLGSFTTASSPALRLMDMACGVLGLIGIVTYHRVHARDLGRRAKWALRIATVAALGLFGVVHAMSR